MISYHPMHGSIQFGSFPVPFTPILESIQFQYATSYLPTLDIPTYSVSVQDTSPFLQEQVQHLISQPIWTELCSSLNISYSDCKIQPVLEMNELYYSFLSYSKKRRYLYGTSTNFKPHTNSFISIPYVYLYCAIIGLSNGNNYTELYFPAWKRGYYLNRANYLIFDFDRTRHQVRINQSIFSTPQYYLKLHFLIYDSIIYPTFIKHIIYQYYIWYAYITRWILIMGTNPITYPQYVIGWFIQLYISPYYLPFMLTTIFGTYLMIMYFDRYTSRIKAIAYSYYGPSIALFSLAFGDWITDI